MGQQPLRIGKYAVAKLALGCCAPQTCSGAQGTPQSTPYFTHKIPPILHVKYPLFYAQNTPYFDMRGAHQTIRWCAPGYQTVVWRQAVSMLPPLFRNGQAAILERPCRSPAPDQHSGLPPIPELWSSAERLQAAAVPRPGPASQPAAAPLWFRCGEDSHTNPRSLRRQVRRRTRPRKSRRRVPIRCGDSRGDGGDGSEAAASVDRQIHRDAGHQSQVLRADEQTRLRQLPRPQTLSLLFSCFSPFLCRFLRPHTAREKSTRLLTEKFGKILSLHSSATNKGEKS